MDLIFNVFSFGVFFLKSFLKIFLYNLFLFFWFWTLAGRVYFLVFRRLWVMMVEFLCKVYVDRLVKVLRFGFLFTWFGY